MAKQVTNGLPIEPMRVGGHSIPSLLPY